MKSNVTKKALAEMVGVTSAAIANYESGKRMPDDETVARLAQSLHVSPFDLFSHRDANLVFRHGSFRKNTALNSGTQELIRQSVEEYFDRFFTIVRILGKSVLHSLPNLSRVAPLDNDEENAKKMRDLLGIAPSGPIPNLMAALEDKGILLYQLEFDDIHFSGMNGMINGNPYIVIKNGMTTERKRSTIAHELAHIVFDWEELSDCKIEEKRSDAISGAFLFPYEDAVRELGVRRSSVSKDMITVAVEYGVSLQLLAKRANICRIISDQSYKDFCISIAHIRHKEPTRIKPERPLLFEQLVYRAVNEGEITIQRGAELLKRSYAQVEDACFGEVQ
jgi:Zn-dependent peptidase ImmA (M78 family)/DNA-binding XRE family transcriptional regulator